MLHMLILWCETSHPSIEEAKKFAEGVRSKYPNKKLAYNCSPSFNWKKNLDATTIAKFQRELGAMGYAFQFVTLAGFHALNYSMFDLALQYKDRGWQLTVNYKKRNLKKRRTVIARQSTKERLEQVTLMMYPQVISGGASSTLALKGSTEAAQFN